MQVRCVCQQKGVTSLNCYLKHLFEATKWKLRLLRDVCSPLLGTFLAKVYVIQTFHIWTAFFSFFSYCLWTYHVSFILVKTKIYVIYPIPTYPGIQHYLQKYL